MTTQGVKAFDRVSLKDNYSGSVRSRIIIPFTKVKLNKAVANAFCTRNSLGGK